MNSPYCSPCSPVARVPVVMTQEEEEDVDDDDCEIVEKDKENDNISPVCAAVRKLISVSGEGGRMVRGNCTSFVADPLATTRRRLFLTPKEKVSRKRKAYVTTEVPIVSP